MHVRLLGLCNRGLGLHDRLLGLCNRLLQLYNMSGNTCKVRIIVKLEDQGIVSTQQVSTKAMFCMCAQVISVIPLPDVAFEDKAQKEVLRP